MFPPVTLEFYVEGAVWRATPVACGYSPLPGPIAAPVYFSSIRLTQLQLRELQVCWSCEATSGIPWCVMALSIAFVSALVGTRPLDPLWDGVLALLDTVRALLEDEVPPLLRPRGQPRRRPLGPVDRSGNGGSSSS